MNEIEVTQLSVEQLQALLAQAQVHAQPAAQEAPSLGDRAAASAGVKGWDVLMATIGLVLFIILRWWTPLQAVFVPFVDDLRALQAKVREADPNSAAIAAAIVTAGAYIGILTFLGHVVQH